MAATRPSLLVELGTGGGESYFGFCQAIAENAIDCRAYAVDNWSRASGEFHFEEVCGYNDSNYSGFSYLLDQPCGNALLQFEDESICILHLNSLRVFDAAMHTFYAWLPKVMPGGIILLPNIMTRHDDFGVWKLWNLLVSQGKTFEFHHSSGLGMFEKPSPQAARCDFVNALLSGDPAVEGHLRRYYSLSAMELDWKRDRSRSPQHPDVCDSEPHASSDRGAPEPAAEENVQDASSQGPKPLLQQQSQSLETERDTLIEQINAQQTRIYLLTESHAALKELQKKYAQLEKANEALQEDHQNLEQSFQRLVNQYQGLERTLHGIINSHSWRITSPLRSLFQRLPRRPR